jgi:hypothetical protein
VFISETGFRVSVEDSKSAQMNAFVSKELFEVKFCNKHEMGLH